MVHVDLAPAWRQTAARRLPLFLSLLAVVSSDGSYCPITVSYEVSLGQAPLATPTAGAIDDFSEIPIFFGKIGIFSNNATINSWRLGWNFTAKEAIQSASNVYTPGVQTIALDPPNVQLEGSGVNDTVKPFSWTEIAFLGTKSTITVPDAQYKVAPVDDVVFNNLVCARLPLQGPSQAPAPAPSSSQQYIAAPMMANASIPSPIYIEYAPVVYLHNQPSSGSDEWQSDLNSLITFLVRVANVGSSASIYSEDVAFQYWFNGPMDLPDAADPLSQLTMDCLDATTGCNDLTYNITTGLPNVAGAKYVLNVGFQPGAFVFLNQTEGNMSTSLNNVSVSPPVISVYEALLRIESRQFLREMNATLDYSYLDTPRSGAPISNTTNIVPRLAEANDRIPAYVNNQPAWGSKPIAILADTMASPPSPASTALSGVTCVGGAQSNTSSGGSSANGALGQVCGLSAIYCCYTVSNEPVSTEIPSQWPPNAAPIPAGLENASLDCASGNCTENAPAPAAVPPAQPAGMLQPGSPLQTQAPPFAPGSAEAPAPGPGALSLYSQQHVEASSSGLSHGAAAGVAAVAGVIVAALAGLVAFVACKRRRSAAGCLPGRPQAKPDLSGLPTTLRPSVYKQGSTDSEMPFLGQRLFAASWMANCLPWLHKQPATDDAEASPPASDAAFNAEETDQVALATPGRTRQQRPSTAPARHSSDDGPQGMELMPQDLRGSRRKHVQLGRLAAHLPGAAQLQAAGQLPQRLIIPHEDDRALVAGAGAMQGAMPLWQLEAARRRRQAQGGGMEAGPRLNLPHGYIAQSASDLMLFTNPLVQDTLPPDWENRVRDAMALQLEGGGSSSAPAQTPNLVGEVLGRARTPRWLGDPYGVDEQGPQAMGPDRVSLPNIAARSRHGAANGTLPGARRLAQTVPHLSSSDSSLVSLDWAAQEGAEQAKPGLRRVQSWAGEMRAEDARPDPLPLQRRHLHRLSASSANLPPLAVLPPPISMGVPPPANIDMDVDFDAEIKPHLCTCLGQGGFGSVFEAQWRGKPVAVKVLLSPEMGSRTVHFDALRREVQLAARFNSERLVQVYGASLKDPAHACLVMELVKGGNLHQRIYDRSAPRLTHLEILQIAHDMAEGLAYLHPSVVHRDLKPQNILLDVSGRAKIADFGISRVKDPAKTFLSTTNVHGTPQYMAPEQFAGAHCDEKVDVFALATILNECATRRPPWRDFGNAFQIIVQVAIKAARPTMDASTPEPLKRLIAKCWAQDPRVRPSCYEIMRLTEILLAQAKRRSEAGSGSTVVAAEQ